MEDERFELRRTYLAETGREWSQPVYSNTPFTDEYTLWLEEQIINQKQEK